MRSHSIKSFVDFVQHSDVYDLLVHNVIFRGQSVQGSLLPSIARGDPAKDTTLEEQRDLEELRLLGATFLPTTAETELDLMVRAQHFGLKTRLLDWTSNSLAALWFACASSSKGEVFVYALEADDLLSESSVYEQSPFRTMKTRVLRPRLNNPRIIAQHGWFTLHRYSKKAGRFVPIEDNRDTKQYLTEFRIPSDKRQELLVALDRHGVSSRTLFPDIGGLCQYLNWRRGAT